MADSPSSNKRLTRHQMQEPDQFLSAMDHLLRYTGTHRTQVLAGGVLLLVVTVGAIGGVSWWRSRQARAAEALGTLLAVVERPLRGSAEEQPGTRPKDPFPDAASRDNAIIQEADALLAAHDSTSAARGARLLKAEALVRRGRVREAMPLFAAVAGANPNDALSVSAALAEAGAQAALGETEAAVSKLTLLATSASPFVPRDLALKLAAEILAGAGHGDQAVKLYQRVIDDAPQSPFVAEAKSKITELSAQADAAPAVTATP